MSTFFDILNPSMPIKDGAVLLPRFALNDETVILEALNLIISTAPFRHMETPNGFRMSVAMTNCGTKGWLTDHSGYRYTTIDPITQKSWPPMPDIFLKLAIRAASVAGFDNFIPDSCLINCYQPGAKLSLHQDKDEQSLSDPIVSVSLGLSATFLFGGLKRTDPKIKIPLNHGDVVVWGGPTRLCFHGILPIKDGKDPLLGRKRINLTFRKG